MMVSFKTSALLCVCSAFFCLSAACGGQPPTSLVATPTATSMLSPSPAPALTLTPSATAVPVSPTRTLLPTWTRTPTVTASATDLPTLTPSATAIPTKAVLILDGYGGGDGGSAYDYLFGRDRPRLVLYDDGQLIIATARGWQTTRLTQVQIKDLLNLIRATGLYSIPEVTPDFSACGKFFYDCNNPIYSFGGTSPASIGAGGHYIRINGPNPRHIDIYGPFSDFVVSPIKRLVTLLDNYRPGSLQLYTSDRIVLWVERGDAWTRYCSGCPTPAPGAPLPVWPADISSLNDLLGKPEGRAIYVQGNLAKRLARLSNGLYASQGHEYYVIIRPLLPHETLEDVLAPDVSLLENQFP